MTEPLNYGKSQLTVCERVGLLNQIEALDDCLADVRAFLEPITLGTYRGASNFAIADIEGFREQQQAAKKLLAVLNEGELHARS